MRYFRRNEKGGTVIMALLVMAVLSLLGISVLNMGDTELKIVSNQQSASKAFALAEAGIQRVGGVFKHQLKAGVDGLGGQVFSLKDGTYRITVKSSTEKEVDVESTGAHGSASRTLNAKLVREVIIPGLSNPAGFPGALSMFGNQVAVNLPNADKSSIDGRDWVTPANFDCNGGKCDGTLAGGDGLNGLFTSSPTPTISGNTAGIVGGMTNKSNTTAEQWKAVAEALRKIASDGSDGLGTRAAPKIVYIPDQSKTKTLLKGSQDAAGILIVERGEDLTLLSGTAHYEGLIIVLNEGFKDRFSSTTDIFGAVVMLGNSTAEFKGNARVKYSTKALRDVNTGLVRAFEGNPEFAQVKMTSWRDMNFVP